MVQDPKYYDWILWYSEMFDSKQTSLFNKADSLDSFMDEVTEKLRRLPESSPEDLTDSDLLEMAKAWSMIDLLTIHGSPPAVSGQLLSTRFADKLQLVGMDTYIPESLKRYATDASSYIRGKSTEVNYDQVKSLLIHRPEDGLAYNNIQKFEDMFQIRTDELIQAQRKLEATQKLGSSKVELLQKQFDYMEESFALDMQTATKMYVDASEDLTESDILMFQMIIDKLKVVVLDSNLPPQVRIDAADIHRDYQAQGYHYK